MRLAIKRGHTGIVRMFLPRLSESVLSFALNASHIRRRWQITRLLVLYNPYCTSYVSRSDEILCASSEKGDVEVVKMMLSSGSSLNSSATLHSLKLALYAGHSEIVCHLLMIQNFRTRVSLLVLAKMSEKFNFRRNGFSPRFWNPDWIDCEDNLVRRIFCSNSHQYVLETALFLMSQSS
jgi:hypothetical protein